MVTAVRAQPAEPIVSTGSLPSASRDHACERWLKVGTAGPAAAENPLADHAARASVMAPTVRYPLFTPPSYGRGWVKSSSDDVGFESAWRSSSLDCYHGVTALAKQAGQVALVSGEREASIEHIIGGDGCSEVVGGLVAEIDSRRRLDFGGERDRDQADVVAMGAGDLDE